jgi:hypothetical protein
LLLSILSVHPNIYAVPEETKAFCPGAYSHGEFPDTIEGVETYDPADVDPASATFHPNLVYSYLLDDLDSLGNVHRWCEKTPKNILFAEEILEYFGSEARFLHIVRDGRNVVTSRHPGSPDSYYVPPERWVRDVSAARDMEGHPQFHTVRYEDVIDEPKNTLSEVFSFLGDTFPQESLQAYPRSSQFAEDKGWGKPEQNENLLSQLQADHTRYDEEEHQERVHRLLEVPEAPQLLDKYGYD